VPARAPVIAAISSMEKSSTKMQEQHGAMRRGKVVQNFHECGLLLFADENLNGTGFRVGKIVLFIDGNIFRALPSPVLGAFLVGNAKSQEPNLSFSRNAPICRAALMKLSWTMSRLACS